MMLHDGYRKLAWVSEITPVRTAVEVMQTGVFTVIFVMCAPHLLFKGEPNMVWTTPHGTMVETQSYLIWGAGLLLHNYQECNIKFITVQ